MKEKLLATKVYTMTYEETLELINLLMTNVTHDVKTALEFIAAGHRVPYLKPGDYVKIMLPPENLNDIELMEDYGTIQNIKWLKTRNDQSVLDGRALITFTSIHTRIPKHFKFGPYEHMNIKVPASSKPQIRCYKCRSTGDHTPENCPHDTICDRCGEEGHRRATCPGEMRPERGQPLGEGGSESGPASALEPILSPEQPPNRAESSYASVTKNKITPSPQICTSNLNGDSHLTVLKKKGKKHGSRKIRKLLLSSSGSSSDEEGGSSPQGGKDGEIRETTEVTQEKDNSHPKLNEQNNEIQDGDESDPQLRREVGQEKKSNEGAEGAEIDGEEIKPPPTPGISNSEEEIDASEEGEIKSSSTSPESLIETHYNKIQSSTPRGDYKKNSARTWQERGSPGGSSPLEKRQDAEQRKPLDSGAPNRNSGIPRPRGTSLESAGRRKMSDGIERGRSSSNRNPKHAKKFKARSLSEVKSLLKSQT